MKERKCRKCGAPALPIEYKQGRICKDCLLAYQKAMDKKRSKTHFRPCKYCGSQTKTVDNVCQRCKDRISREEKNKLREFPDYDFQKESEIARWNRNHPITPEVVRGFHIAMQKFFDDLNGGN